MDKLIQFSDFSFRYKSQVYFTLHNIDLEIYRGEKLLILGASGSGKSTLAKCINGIIPNNEKGEIKGELKLFDKSYNDQNIHNLSKKVGTVLQDSDAQFVGLSVEEDIAFSLENDRVDPNQMRCLVNKAANKVRISHKLKNLPFELSGGEKQRAGLAGILHEDIDIVLLDEPLAALDPQMGENIVEIIDELNKEGKTIVIIEHRFEDVLYKDIDRVVLMDEGKIIKIATPDELIHSNILSKYGIREPLYISAIKKIFGGLKQENKLSKLDNIDLSKYNKIDFKSDYVKVKNENKKIIELTNAEFSYDSDEFIKIDSLEISQGERIAVLGHNGSGKTTLAKILTGLINLNNGEIHRLDNPKSIKEIAKTIGYVMQNPNKMLVTDSVYNEIALALRLREFDEEYISNKVEEVLKLTGLYELRKWPINVLSYGQKKRLSVAVVLALEPKCIILDEPTAGQDYYHYREMMEFVNRLNKQKNITFIFITHDMHLALEYTDRAIVIQEGKIIADKASFDVLNNIDLLVKSSLKKTSIFELSEKLGLDTYGFISKFIEVEREEKYE